GRVRRRIGAHARHPRTRAPRARPPRRRRDDRAPRRGARPERRRDEAFARSRPRRERRTAGRHFCRVTRRVAALARAMISYAGHAPAPELRDCVECYWSIDSTGAPHRVLPDACSDLLFVVGRASSASVIGVMSRAIVTPAGEPETLLGVRFRPGHGAALI